MMIDLASIKFIALKGPFKSGLIFLFHLAWKSRVRLPVLIAIGFMVLDIRLQVDINIDLGIGGIQGGGPAFQDDNDQPESDAEETLTGDTSSDSYTTDSYSLQSIYNDDHEFDSNYDDNFDDHEGAVVFSNKSTLSGCRLIEG